MGVMDIKNFKTYEDLAYEVMKKMPSVESTIDIVCFYEDAKQIIRELILTGACTVGNIELYEPEWDGYEDEYYLSVSKFDDEWQIWCQPAFDVDKGIYLYGEADICYILDNCNSRILHQLKSHIVYETHVDEMNEEYEDDICMCPECCAEREADKVKKTISHSDVKMDDDMKGFIISSSDDYGYSSFSFHSTDESLVKEMMKIYKKF